MLYSFLPSLLPYHFSSFESSFHIFLHSFLLFCGNYRLWNKWCFWNNYCLLLFLWRGFYDDWLLISFLNRFLGRFLQRACFLKNFLSFIPSLNFHEYSSWLCCHWLSNKIILGYDSSKFSISFNFYFLPKYEEVLIPSTDYFFRVFRGIYLNRHSLWFCFLDYTNLASFLLN